MTHGSVFSGIGGFDLASEWMGWENVFHCEWNEFGKQVLKYYWPKSIAYDDITKTDFTIHRGTIDVLSGGFPCQPYSTAGKRLGKEDERHLWPEMLRAIREIQPAWVVWENVSGLISWNGGMVFDEVQTDLEAAGYEVIPFVLPACGVNAPHRRDRVWFVAKRTYQNPDSNGRGSNERKEESSIRGFWDLSTGDNERIPTNDDEVGDARHSQLTGLERGVGLSGAEGFKPGHKENDATNTGSIELQGRMHPDRTGEAKRYFSSCNQRIDGGTTWDNFPTQPPVRGRNDGLLSSTPGVTIPENRNNMDRNLVIQLCLKEGRLKVDFETGKIYSLKQRGKEGQMVELVGCDCNGYIVHGIRYNGFKIQLRSHQIVWIAANGDYDKSRLMIDHVNRDRKDNRLENLRLVDAKGNRENATPYMGKLTEEQKDMMVWLYKEDGIPMSELADDYGISKSRVQQIISEHSVLYGITVSKHRKESIKGYGNAVVPQVVLQIFKAIEQWNQYRN